MRNPEPTPFGEQSLRAMVRAICVAEPLNVRAGGSVESVVTRQTHCFFERFFILMTRRGAEPRHRIARVRRTSRTETHVIHRSMRQRTCVADAIPTPRRSTQTLRARES